MKGLLNINKSSGMTSSNVVCKIRRMLNTRDVGHMGTLDPQGSGVMVIGVGKATRLFDYYLSKDKLYDAEFEFGYETDTLDKDGLVQKTTQIIPTEAEIKNALSLQMGEIMQIPPLYSAKNIDGKRAYDLARENKSFTLKPSKITVFDIKLAKKTGENKYLFRIHCSSGTYIRSICRDLAYSLNSLATMVSICRIKSGQFDIQTAVSLEEVEKNGQNLSDFLISVEQALKDLPRVDLDSQLYKKLSNGVKIPFVSQHEKFSVYCNNELFGIGCAKQNFLKIITYLKD